MRPYTLADGLPQSQVYDVVQDSVGYLWLGTQGGGLARFDGEDFKIFNENDGLTSNYIQSLLVVKDSLFIGTKKGVSILVNETITSFKGPQVHCIFNDGEQTYFGTNTGIYQLKKDATLSQLTLSKTLNDGKINDFLFDGKNYWIASKEGLFRTEFLYKRSPISQVQFGDFTSLALYKKTLFAASFNEGISLINISEEKIETIKKPQRINDIAIIENQLWVSTDNDGLTAINIETLQFEKKLGKANGLSVSHIRKSFEDRNGVIWIATSGGGFYKYFPNQFTHFDKDTGLNGNRVYATHAVENALWFSVAERGLSVIDSLGIKNIESIQGFENVKIKTLASDNFGNIWAGSDGKGLLYRETIKEQNIVVSGADISDIKVDTLVTVKTVNHLINESNGFPSNWIRQIYVESNNIWVATYADGIVKFKYNNIDETLTILNVFGKEEGIEDLLIVDLKPDNQSRIWYSTQKGHLGYIEENTVTHLGDVLNSNTSINSLLFNEDTLFLGTAGNGIWASTGFDYSKFQKLKGAKNITSQNSFQLIFDAQGNLWTGSERGIDNIIINNENEIVDVFHYGRNDGFLGIETCLNAATRDAQNNLWFGAIYGLTKYNTNQTTNQNNLKPVLRFEDIKVDYSSINTLGKWEYQNNSLQLKPEQNQISFSYRTVDLDHPKAIQYRYKLDNTEWSPWHKNNEQNLLGLAYGSHIFTAQSRDFRWQESNPISFTFTIDSPLYAKAWFQWLLIGLLLLLIFFVGYWYLKRIKRKNAAETNRLQLENHLLSLEQKALRLQMNPHFIFNVLNGIKAMGSTDMLKMNNTINSFATLLRGILNNSRKETINLETEIKTLKNYIDVELLMSQKPFIYSIDFFSEISAEEILIPPMLIQPFVENAIRHGISKQTQEGILKITFKTQDDFLHCSITDNGPGIFESQKNKKATDHQSVALDVTKERIASLSKRDTLQLKELENNGKIIGTEITFSIPLETDF
ncbi:histidine kinase [Patiriisocius marinistellae]|uniref:Histidine kinase n=1 Tax=Patiriisocius marinistellae TaxID=2494560 RepID=A0A5J4FY63_9FLAO|nr:histidine kinase [Patiriisocius marinistellae]